MGPVTVIGTTSWGTTLAVYLARQGQEVTLWARTEEEARLLSLEGENRRFLPGIPFPPRLTVTSSLEEALEGAWLVVLAVPSRNLRDTVRHLRPRLRGSPVVLSAVKGLERGTGRRMSQVLEEELPPGPRARVAVLSGPNLSLEIARGLPASTVVASRSERVALRVQEALNSPQLRVYRSTDVVGVELGGALKNIIAIGAGICDGLGFGTNAKSAFITRGLAEITRLGLAAGASPLTLAGLAGLGDLVATCFSPLSRNRRVGEEMARGKPLAQVLADLGQVAEGVDTTAAALLLAERLKVEMPITRATYRVLFEGLPPAQAVSELMGRPPKAEWPRNLIAWRGRDA